MATAKELRALLAKVPIFAELEAPELDALLRITGQRRLRSREVLFRKGAHGSQTYVIVSGRCRASTAATDGKELVLRIMDSGEVIGEISLLDGHPRSATVVALEPTELLMIERRDLLPFLRKHPEVAIKLLEVLGNRLRTASELLEDTLFLNLPARLSRKLLALAGTYGREGPAGLHIELRLSQQELGELIGTSRESVNKQLRAWTEQGVVTMDRRHVTIHKPAVLEQLARLALS